MLSDFLYISLPIEICNPNYILLTSLLLTIEYKFVWIENIRLGNISPPLKINYLLNELDL